MKIVKLGDVCSIINGGTPKTGIAEYWDGDILWITPRDLGKVTERETNRTDRKITQSGIDNSSAKVVPIQSVILSTRAPIGHVVINAEPMAFNQGCRGLVPGDTILAEYLYYFLKLSKEKLNELGTGTTFRELSAGALKNVEIPLLSLEEQRQVVERLDVAFEKIDRAIELTEKNMKKTDLLFKSILEQKIAQQKNGRQTTVGEVTTIKGGKRMPKGHKLTSKQTDHPYIRVSDFDHKGGVDPSNLQFVPDASWRAISNYIITDRDVFLSIAGSIGITGIIPSSLNGANLTENACRLIPNSELNKDYLYFFTLSNSFIEQARGATRTTAQPKLALIRIKKIHFSLPDLESQLSIVSEIRKIKGETERLTEGYREKLKYLKALKQSLLTQAFSQSEVE